MGRDMRLKQFFTGGAHNFWLIGLTIIVLDLKRILKSLDSFLLKDQVQVKKKQWPLGQNVSLSLFYTQNQVNSKQGNRKFFISGAQTECYYFKF